MIFSRSGGSEGIGFAIPSDLALRVLTEIVEHGRVRRGWLGVEVTAPAVAGEAMGLPIARVLPGGPAAQAGLQGNDTIIAIEGMPVSDTAGFSRIVAEYGPGETLDLAIERDGQIYEVQITSGERPPAP
ncbi:MAG: PDZ domain-containing protein [Planctomycetota bacterium]